MGLNTVDTHELAVGSEGDVIQAAVEASVVGLCRSNIDNTQFLHNLLADVVDQIDVRCPVCSIGQHNGAVATHKHALDDTIEVVFSALVAGEFEAGRSSHISGQLRLGIVFIHICRRLVLVCFKQGNDIGRLVGLNSNVARCRGNEFLPLAVNRVFSVFT